MRLRVSCSIGIWLWTSVQPTPPASNSDFTWTKERPGGRKYISLSQNMELGQEEKDTDGWQGQIKEDLLNKEVCGGSGKKYERRKTKELERWQGKDGKVRLEISCIFPNKSGFLSSAEEVNLTFHVQRKKKNQPV